MRCCWCEKDGVEPGSPLCPFCRRTVANILPPGASVGRGRYRIERALGKGGFGITYCAVDTAFHNRRVAVKEFFPSAYAHRDPRSGSISVGDDASRPARQARDGFIREGDHLAGIRHRNVPVVFDRFEENGTAYLVMEFIEGQSVKAMLLARPERRLAEAEIRWLMDGLVEALSAIHERGICHLDIKPDNVMVERSSPAPRVVLVDFGAARQGTDFGATSIAAMTPGYAPPELMSREQYGPETDLYELGVMLHEMWTGGMPPAAAERLYAQRNWQPDPRLIPQPFLKMITQAIALNRTLRPKSIRAWWQQAAATPPAARGEKPVAAAGRAGTPPTAWVGLGICLIATTAIAATLLRKAPDPPAPLPTVESPAAGNAAVSGSGATPAPTPRTYDPSATRRLRSALQEDTWSGAEVREVLAALRAGGDPGVADRLKNTVLHRAVLLGRADLVRSALDAGADPNRAGAMGMPALHMACLKDSPNCGEIIPVLLSGKADPTRKASFADQPAITPLARAAMNKNQAAQKVLRGAGVGE